MTTPTDCRICGGATEDGFVAVTLDLTTTTAFWLEGTPQPEGVDKGISMRHHARRPLVARRCQSCGAVTFFAPS